LTSATCEVVWLQRIVADVEEEKNGPTCINCDNQSVIKLAHNPIYHARSKHIELQHHFVREKIESKEIGLIFVIQMIMWLIYLPNLLVNSSLKFLEAS
jgi:predicted membrane protein